MKFCAKGTKQELICTRIDLNILLTDMGARSLVLNGMTPHIIPNYQNGGDFKDLLHLSGKYSSIYPMFGMFT